jgi:hypothetical protein
MEFIKYTRGQNVDLYDVKAGGTHSRDGAPKGQKVDV